MKDPRHKLDARGDCKRCGLGKRWGKYCPVGFWASKAQHAEIDAPPNTLEKLNRLERKWLAEWCAARSESVDFKNKE